MITEIGNESKDALLCDIFPHIILLGFCDWKWVLLVHGISWWFGEADDSTGLFLRLDYCNAVLAGTISGSPTHCGMYCSGSQATWPHDSSCARVTLVTSRREDPVQVVLAGTQVAFRTYVRVYIGLADISCQCASVVCTACLVIWQPRRPTDTSKNQRQGFFCRRTISMEQAANTAEAAAAVDHYVAAWRSG